MCLAIPAKVISLSESGMASVEIGGVKKDVSVSLIEDVSVGDYVIVHTGFALSKLDPEEAEKTLELFAEMATLTGEVTTH